MAISVLLVDDEKLERILIRRGFDWEGNGFQIIGETGSGQEALEFIQHRRPDAVFTDINMPHMDGLELAEQILRIHPQCHIVIVTGYRDFDYARRAVKLSVEDFLLKPVNMEDVAAVADKIKEEIRTERKKEEEAEKAEQLRNSILADQDILMESFFQRLVERRIAREEGERRLVSYNCEKLAVSCVCVTIRVREKEALPEDPEKEILGMIREKNPEDTVCFIHYMKDIILYFMDGACDRAEEFCRKLHRQCQLQRYSVTLGISCHKEGFDGIAEAFEEAQKAVGASVFLGHDQLVTYQEYQEIMNQSQTKKEMDWEEFTFAVTNTMHDRVREEIKEYVKLIQAARVTDLGYLRLMAMNMLFKAGTCLNKYGTGIIQLITEERFYRELQEVTTLSEMEELLYRDTEQVMEYLDGKRQKHGNKVVGEARNYAEAKLYDPELSLRTVAAAVYSNESYLSRAFKKEQGINLIEYILQRRIEESIVLMNTTDLKVYEIAEKVGFRDPHYFSICFKKQVGITVTEFRARR